MIDRRGHMAKPRVFAFNETNLMFFFYFCKTKHLYDKHNNRKGLRFNQTIDTLKASVQCGQSTHLYVCIFYFVVNELCMNGDDVYEIPFRFVFYHSSGLFSFIISFRQQNYFHLIVPLSPFQIIVHRKNLIIQDRQRQE